MTRSALLVVSLLSSIAIAPSAAVAEEHRPALLTPVGMSLSIGGGIAAFAREDLRAFAGTAGSWDARLTVGTRTPLAVEAAYLGSIQTVDAIGLADDAVLISHGAELALRVNLLDRDWQPYLLGGVAWRRYQLTEVASNTSDLADGDTVIETPVGVGVSFRYEGIVVDGRAVYRSAFADDLMRSGGDRESDLHTLGGSVTVGWEF